MPVAEEVRSMSEVLGGEGRGYGYGGFTSVGAILVLFILLVIISKAFLV
ncbi:dihydroorotate dehydrogenase [Paenibacillus xylanivorans]|uniref:Dihydroorotate dehydrogenase n=1 Tax=Paenibacillus xylanivorans TaxID=1705561 RepID=A0A0M9BNT3_9BACL|nr:dihydroorotate dehydrogenase [Paenibacillus xylanivorans]